MKSIEELQTDRSTFSIGEAFTSGWNLVSKYLGLYIAAGIITVLIGGAAGLIPFIGSLINSLILSPCFMASAVFITWRISMGIGWTDFGDMFKGFKFLSQIMVSSLIQMVVMVFFLVLFFFNMLPQIFDLVTLSQSQDVYNNQDEIKALLMGFLNAKTIILFSLFMIAVLLVSVIWAFKTHFIVIYKMEAWPAMELSRKICTRNLFPMIGLFLLLFIVIIISAIPCGIGLLFTLPLSIGAVYNAFSQITHCHQPDEVKFDFMGEGKV
jgi:hypothetical protein